MKTIEQLDFFFTKTCVIISLKLTKFQQPLLITLGVADEKREGAFRMQTFFWYNFSYSCTSAHDYACILHQFWYLWTSLIEFCLYFCTCKGLVNVLLSCQFKGKTTWISFDSLSLVNMDRTIPSCSWTFVDLKSFMFTYLLFGSHIFFQSQFLVAWTAMCNAKISKASIECHDVLAKSCLYWMSSHEFHWWKLQKQDFRIMHFRIHLTY